MDKRKPYYYNIPPGYSKGTLERLCTFCPHICKSGVMLRHIREKHPEEVPSNKIVMKKRVPKPAGKIVKKPVEKRSKRSKAKRRKKKAISIQTNEIDQEVTSHESNSTFQIETHDDYSNSTIDVESFESISIADSRSASNILEIDLQHQFNLLKIENEKLSNEVKDKENRINQISLELKDSESKIVTLQRDFHKKLEKEQESNRRLSNKITKLTDRLKQCQCPRPLVSEVEHNQFSPTIETKASILDQLKDKTSGWIARREVRAKRNGTKNPRQLKSFPGRKSGVNQLPIARPIVLDSRNIMRHGEKTGYSTPMINVQKLKMMVNHLSSVCNNNKIVIVYDTSVFKIKEDLTNLKDFVKSKPNCTLLRSVDNDDECVLNEAISTFGLIVSNDDFDDFTLDADLWVTSYLMDNCIKFRIDSDSMSIHLQSYGGNDFVLEDNRILTDVKASKWLAEYKEYHTN